MSNLAIFNMASGLYHFKPVHVADRLTGYGFPNRIVTTGL
jgi:hypothetical protein